MDRTPNRTVIVSPGNRPRTSEPRGGNRRSGNGGSGSPPPPAGRRRRDRGPQPPDPRRTMLTFAAAIGAAFGGSFALTLRLSNPQLPSVPLLQTQSFAEKSFPGKPLADLEAIHGTVDLNSIPDPEPVAIPDPLATMTSPVQPDLPSEPEPEPAPEVTPEPEPAPESEPAPPSEPTSPTAPAPVQ